MAGGVRRTVHILLGAFPDEALKDGAQAIEILTLASDIERAAGGIHRYGQTIVLPKAEG